MAPRSGSPSEARQNVRRAIGEHHFRADALDRCGRLRSGVAHEGRAARRVGVDADRLASQENAASRLHHDLGELHAERARPALDEDAADAEESALRQREKRPPHAARIVGVIAEVAGDGELRRLVVAERARQHVVERGAPVADERAQRQGAAQQRADGAFFARPVQVDDARLHALHQGEQPIDSRPARGKATRHRRARGLEADRQIEGLADRAAAHRKERRDRNPLDLVDEAERREDVVLGFAGVARIGGLMQGRLDRQRALLVGRSGAADAVIALDDANLAAGLGQQGGGRQASQS